MASLSQARKEEIAAELRRAATWVSGPRSAKLRSLADEIAGDTPDEPPEQPEPPKPPRARAAKAAKAEETPEPAAAQ